MPRIPVRRPGDAPGSWRADRCVCEFWQAGGRVVIQGHKARTRERSEWLEGGSTFQSSIVRNEHQGALALPENDILSCHTSVSAKSGYCVRGGFPSAKHHIVN